MPSSAVTLSTVLAVALVSISFLLLEYLRHTNQLATRQQKVIIGLLLTFSSLFFTALVVARILSFLQ